MFIAMSVSVNKTYSAADLKFLNLLSEKFPTIADATTEIINLEAILNLSLIHISSATSMRI